MLMNIIKSLYYHSPDLAGFERMVGYYQKKGYRFISVEELFTRLNANNEHEEKLAFISLDDGRRRNLQLIPIIEQYNVPICIFVSTEPLCSGNYWWDYVIKERGFKQMIEFKKLSYQEFYSQLGEMQKRNELARTALTVDEVKMLANHPLVSIQSHTVHHPILTHVPNDVLHKELSESKSFLESLTGKEVFAFSYPNGSLTSREVDACRDYYKLAFTTEQRNISLDDDVFLLPRYALTGDYYRDLLKVKGIWKILKGICRIFHF